MYIRGALAFLAMATCVEFVDAPKADFVQALSLLGLLEESACAIIDSTIDILIQWTQLLHPSSEQCRSSRRSSFRQLLE